MLGQSSRGRNEKKKLAAIMFGGIISCWLLMYNFCRLAGKRDCFYN